MMSRWWKCAAVAALASFCVVGAPVAQAMQIKLDYSYDSNNFFGAGNPSGAAAGAYAKAALEAAASFYSEILNDTLSAVSAPAPFVSSASNGTVNWNWTMHFKNPSNGVNLTLPSQRINANEYRIYVGARSISGNTLGIGGPGGFGWSSVPSGTFAPSEITQIEQITEQFGNTVTTRGETSGFSSWGGAVTFDRDAAANWHFNYPAEPTGNKNDFYSVAIHEMAHALGLGASEQWNNWVSNSRFTGPAVVAEYGGPAPLKCSGGCGHWAEGTQSTILGTSIPQEAAMDPTVTNGTRKVLTTLDAAALTDIGWEVVAPSFHPADFNTDGVVDGLDAGQWQGDYGLNGDSDANNDNRSNGLDLTYWQRAFRQAAPVYSAPEPASSILLATAGLLSAWATRRMR